MANGTAFDPAADPTPARFGRGVSKQMAASGCLQLCEGPLSADCVEEVGFEVIVAAQIVGA
jgi:hypothetical protein